MQASDIRDEPSLLDHHEGTFQISILKYPQRMKNHFYRDRSQLTRTTRHQSVSPLKNHWKPFYSSGEPDPDLLSFWKPYSAPHTNGPS